MRSLTQHKAEGRRAYERPAIRLVLISDDADLLQGVIETSGTTGPTVNPDHPGDSEAPDLTNGNSVWDH